MSAPPNVAAPDMDEFEIDGKPVSAPKGSMIIQATDAASIPVPRFCYHRKLPIAANCRQCMVEVEMGGKMVPKPQPACATPVAPGMKVFTRSPNALKWQRNAMEFLLINHPLDCPICDQGGECELQDISLGYGRSVSRFTERKRSVADEDIGPLVATEMTRCIHCTRCVRFVGEIAGTHELGDFDRGDSHVIGTYIGRTIESELSGNVIDVCPLGADQWLHTRRGKVLRVVPRENEAINECWLSDRDRYSHEGLYADDRALKPMIRKGAELVEVEWDEAIAFVAENLRNAGAGLGALLAPLTSCEEGHLLAAIVRGLGGDRIDHRLRVQDFSDGGPGGETFELPVAQLDKVRAALLVGSDPRREIPLVNHRLRQATRRDPAKPAAANPAHYDISARHGARIYAINPARFDFNYPLAGEVAVAPQHLVDAMLRMAKAAGVSPDDRVLAEAIAAAPDDGDARAWVAALREAEPSVVILGDAAVQHPQASWLRALAQGVARATGSAYDEFPAGANAAGLARVGARPRAAGHDAASMLRNPPKSLLVWHAGSQDTFAPAAFDRARGAADFCVYAGAYACAGVRAKAHAVLPIGLPPEIDGTYVNVDGTVQACAAGAALPGDARPGWKVLRALGAALGIAGFDFTDIGELRARIAGELSKPAERIGQARTLAPAQRARRDAPPLPGGEGLCRLATVPIYRSDAVVRRAKALQAHPLNRKPALRLHENDARAHGLLTGVKANVDGAVLPVVVDPAVPEGCAWIEAGHQETASLPPGGAVLTITKA